MGLSNEVVGSTASGIDIIVAQQDHVPIVQRMLSAAFHRVAALGYQQWWDPFPLAVIEDSVLRGDTYVAVERQVVVGTIALSWKDTTFWGKHPPDAGYVHRLCTDPVIARKGLGVELLSWADNTIASRGREWLRLDTPASNRRLRTYYESLEFRCRGEIDVTLSGARGVPEIWRAALYERAVPTSSVR